MRRDYGQDDYTWDEDYHEASSYDEASRSRYRRARRGGGPSSGDYEGGLRVLYRLFLICSLVVAARLVWLQAINSHNLSEQGMSSRTRTVTLHAKRGTIYDRNGNVLAVSVECKNVFCVPPSVNDVPRTADLLADVLGGDRKDYIDILRTDDTFAYIERQVDKSRADQLAEELERLKLEGVYFEDDMKREYPYGDLAGQVLGIVNIDGKALTGIEKVYDEVLQGVDGEMVMELGNGGTPIAGATNIVTPAQDGSDLVLSLDVDIQRVAEEHIVQAVKDYQADSGSVMVTDPHTGEILAACSTPLLPITHYWDMEAGADTLKLVTSSYEPGSIFKVLTSSIGIETNAVTPWSTFTVDAAVQVGDDYVWDDDGRDYTMSMTLAEMMRRSSNTGMALIAQTAIGEQAFAQGVEAFGIGSATGIDYPGEVDGIVRSLEEYDGSTLGTMAFGQGLAIPLVQMVKAVGTVANRGVPNTPHFAISCGGQALDWPSGELVVTPETCEQVVDMMREVVRSGTAVNAQIDGYDIAGKTGTGEQVDENGGYLADKFMSSLIGFAPASDPEILVYVGLNGTPYLAYASAAPTFSSIMGEALIDLGVQPEW